jgi:hypothetical protein
MLIDCDRCTVRGLACGDCVVTVLLSRPPSGVRLDHEEQVAIGALAASGLVPPLRLVTPGRAELSESATADPTPVVPPTMTG